MALNLPNFRQLGAADYGGFDLGRAVKSGIETAWKPSQLAEELLKAKLSNKINQPYADNAQRSYEADVGGREATMANTQENTLRQKIMNEFLPENQKLGIEKQKLSNQYFPQHEEATINNLNALGNMRKSGLFSGGSTGSKDEAKFMNDVQLDNPNLSQEQIREAANAYAEGRNSLSDGTPLAEISPTTRRSLDRAVKSTSTAAMINSQGRANQAEAEIDKLQEYATQGLKPYGDTFAGYSPQQILDTFKSDEDSQKQLGKLVASQALQYEIAQQRIKLANGQPGVTSTNELMALSRQNIKTRFPRMSQVAREETARYMTEALKAGNRERQKIGFSPSKFTSEYQPNKGGASGESVGMYKDGQIHFIPLSEAKDAEKMGYKYER